VSKQSPPITVHILEKEYRIACKPGDEEGLLDSSKLLDKKMREVRETGKVLGTDRVAVMAALNLASDLVKHKIKVSSDENISQRIHAMHVKIDNALNQVNTLEV